MYRKLSSCHFLSLNFHETCQFYLECELGSEYINTDPRPHNHNLVQIDATSRDTRGPARGDDVSS